MKVKIPSNKTYQHHDTMHRKGTISLPWDYCQKCLTSSHHEKTSDKLKLIEWGTFYKITVSTLRKWQGNERRGKTEKLWQTGDWKDKTTKSNVGS